MIALHQVEDLQLGESQLAVARHTNVITASYHVSGTGTSSFSQLKTDPEVEDLA